MHKNALFFVVKVVGGFLVKLIAFLFSITTVLLHIILWRMKSISTGSLFFLSLSIMNVDVMIFFL